MACFEINHLTFSYPGAAAPALSDVSLSIEQGSFTLICGASGCGKSTFLRQLKTVLTPAGVQTGELYFEGRPLSGMSESEQAASIGFVLQNPSAQIVCDTVWHELAFGLENLGLDPQRIRLRVAEMANYFGIHTWFNKRIEELSGGQKQLLNLAAVMAMQPSVLILDEPTAQLDPMAAREFLDTLHRVNLELGVTVILAEHRLEDVLPLTDVVLALDKGSCVVCGAPRQACEALYDTPLNLALPSALRIARASELDSACPFTVREGRSWLDGHLQRFLQKNGHGDADSALQHRELFPLPSQAFNTSSSSQQNHRRSIKDKPILQAKDLWFRYNKTEPDVLQSFSFSAYPGDFCALLGGNGAGKSTALALFAGIERAYSGKVLLKGKQLKQLQSRFSKTCTPVALLAQDPLCLFTADTILEDLQGLLEGMEGLTAQERTSRLDRVVKQLSIASLLNRHPFDLSGGELQRAALAKVLLLEPEVLLLDEPTKGLDAFAKEELGLLLLGLCTQGVTIVMATHDIEFCARFAFRCALLFDGALVADGSTHEVFAGNSFYTTAANRMARHVFPQAITAEEVAELCKMLKS